MANENETDYRIDQNKDDTKKRSSYDDRFVLALPIFPGRRQPSIVGRDELNYRVRNGNGWTLILISTNYCIRLSPETNRIIEHLTLFVKKNW